MAFCSKCGNELDNMYSRCERCGHMMQQGTTKSNQPDDGGFLWGLLGFCMPVVGLILYLLWKYERPNTALVAGKGAIFGVIGIIVVYILYFIFIFAMLPDLY